jgi:hypothetical protein
MDENPERLSYDPELTQPPTASPAAKQSAVQRLWMMFTSPGEVFADIAVKPTWVLLMVILVVLGVATQVIIAPHIDTEASIRARLADRADELSDAQIERMVEQGEKFSKFGPIIGLVIAPIAWALMAAVFLVMLKIVGSDIDYVRSLSTTLHAYWPPTAVALVLMSILVQRVGKVPQEELANVVKANLGAFMSPDAPAWLASVASTISIFNIWAVILLVIGFEAVGKISRGKAVTAALVPWVLWIAIKAGLATVFG